MKLDIRYKNLEIVKEDGFVLLNRNKEAFDESAPLISEHVLDIYINELLTMKVVCSPQYLEQLVLGRLLTEGVISGADDIESVYICEKGSRARVILKNHDFAEQNTFVETTQSCCSGNHILNDVFVKYPDLESVAPIPLTKDTVFALADKFSEGSALHRATTAAHSCFLSRNDHILFECEDIGRHNALDKAIGFALLNDIPLNECILFSSGRIAVDMAAKAIKAKVPVLMSKAAATYEAVSLAKEYNLTLICAARSDRAKVLSGTLQI